MTWLGSPQPAEAVLLVSEQATGHRTCALSVGCALGSVLLARNFVGRGGV